MFSPRPVLGSSFDPAGFAQISADVERTGRHVDLGGFVRPSITPAPEVIDQLRDVLRLFDIADLDSTPPAVDELAAAVTQQGVR